MPKKVRRILTIALAIIFLSSAGVVIYQLFQYREGDEAYTEAEELVQLPELPEPAEELDVPPEQAARDRAIRRVRAAVKTFFIVLVFFMVITSI